jgi:hypothetical protein
MTLVFVMIRDIRLLQIDNYNLLEGKLLPISIINAYKAEVHHLNNNYAN